MKRSGVYAIVHRDTARRYVGSSVDIDRRFAEHRLDLAKGTHHCVYLQRAWDKYGAEAFDFIVLELLDTSNSWELAEAEQRHLDEGNCFNSNPRADRPPSRRGLPIHPNAKAAFLASNKARKGQPLTPAAAAHLKRIQDMRRGATLSPEHKRALSRKGAKLTPEQRLRLSESHKGVKMPPRSEEHKKLLSEANLGKRHSEEAKQKMRLAKLGKPRSRKGSHQLED